MGDDILIIDDPPQQQHATEAQLEELHQRISNRLCRQQGVVIARTRLHHGDLETILVESSEAL